LAALLGRLAVPLNFFLKQISLTKLVPLYKVSAFVISLTKLSSYKVSAIVTQDIFTGTVNADKMAQNLNQCSKVSFGNDEVVFPHN